MSSAVAPSKAPSGFPNRPVRSRLVRLMRMAVAFLVVAGSLGLATVTATAQSSSSTCPSAGAAAYADLTDRNNYAYNDSRCLKELGIPAPGNNYRPDDVMTRSEMARFMARTYAIVTGADAPIVATSFTDVSADDPNADDIARIFGLEITTGTTPTTYSPDAPVIRGHMALFLARLYKQATGTDAPTSATPFTDISNRTPEQETAIGQIYRLGVTTGTTTTTYSPGDVVTRRQMASFVARIYRALNAVTSGTAADAPTDVEVAVSGNTGTALALSWDAPARTGSSGIIDYVIQWKIGDTSYTRTNQRTAATTSATFSGLTQGDTYTFRVAARTTAGLGAWSDEAAGNPAVAPGLVRDLRSAPRNASLALSWTAPADDGGGDITGYVISWRTGRQSTSTAEIDDGAATSYTITGLRNSTVYSVWVQAVNAAGTGDDARVPPGNGNVSVTPTPSAPTVPQDLTVTAGSQTLTLRWKEPADDGGTTFTGYNIEYRCGSASRFNVASGSPLRHNSASLVQTITIRNLANGTHCDVRVSANSYYDADRNTFRGGNEPILTSPWAQSSGTPATLPSPPAIVTVTTAHESLQVSWTPPSNTGGSAITGYKLTWSAGVPASVVIGNRTSYTITGLDNRYAYTVSVRTITAVGQSSESFASGSTQPQAVPAAPRNVQVHTAPLLIKGDPNPQAGTSLVVTWDPPPSNGTNPVDGYVVQRRESLIPSTTPGGSFTPAGPWFTSGVGTVDAFNRTATIGGLVTGTSYDIRVQATNDHDTNTVTSSIGGPWAMASGTPATAPAAVTPTLEPGHTSMIVEWEPPADNGSDITHYLVRYAENNTGNEPYSTDIRVDAPARRTRITGLKVGVPYVVQVQAVNAIGTGPNLAHEIGTYTGLFPDPPTSVTAVPTPDGNGNTLTVTWNRVTRTNGAGPVNSYVVETLDITSPGNTWVPTAGIDANTTMAVVNVSNGRTYLVRVRAVALFNGSSGYADAPVTAAGSPAPPTSLAATLATDGRTVNVVWTAASPGSPTDIISYTVSWFSPTNPVHGARGNVLITSNTRGTYSIYGLPPGSYTVQVVATNHIGNSLPRTANVTVPAR